MASKTPNLDLLKKDPVADGNDTFNIETMLNENWDKLDAAVGEVREELKEVHVPSATLTKPGIVQLSSATDSSSEALAATPKAVKSAYDAAVAAQSTANQAFQSGNERKAEVVATLVAKGVPASTSESWDSLIGKMAAIVKATGSAMAAQVLSGYTFSNDAANGLLGGMPNRSAENGHMPGSASTTWPGDRVFIQPPAGYYNGESWVTTPAPSLVEGNLPKDVNILGVQGVLERMTTPEKQSIADAITGKGVPASINESNAVLAHKIKQIRTSSAGMADLSLLIDSKHTGTPVNGGTFDLLTIPPGMRVFCFAGDAVVSDRNVLSYFRVAGNVHSWYVEMVDSQGNIATLLSGLETNSSENTYISRLDCNYDSRTITYQNQYNNKTTSSFPISFSNAGNITLRVRLLAGGFGALECNIIGRAYFG